MILSFTALESKGLFTAQWSSRLRDEKFFKYSVVSPTEVPMGSQSHAQSHVEKVTKQEDS